jgi:hypothetical protein
VEAVAAGDIVAGQLAGLAGLREGDPGPLAADVVEGHVAHLEKDRVALGQPQGDQVLDHLLLTVDGDRPAAGQLEHVDAVALVGELEVHAVVGEALAGQALAGADGVEQLDAALLQHAGAHAPLDIGAVAVLQHQRLDAPLAQQVGQGQARRPRPDDRDLGVHSSPSNRSVAGVRRG